MHARIKAQLKAWDRKQRSRVVGEMFAATESGDLAKTRRVLAQHPLIEWFAPDEASTWAPTAAAAGQLKLLKFWVARDAAAGKRPVPVDELFFQAMGDVYVRANRGDPLAVAEYLLKQGAAVDGPPKAEYTPLHQAVVMNRPQLVELLIRRGADVRRPCVTGESALQIARQNQRSKACARILEKAGAPLELPRKPERPKRPKTVDLRQSAAKLKAGVEQAVKRFARMHGGETVTAVALASIPHEGYVMVSFDTGAFQGSPWDCTRSEFAWVKFPQWAKAHEPDTMEIIGLDGSSRSGEAGAFESDFLDMIVAVLKQMQAEGAFHALKRAKGCKVGIEMTGSGDAKFWKLS